MTEFATDLSGASDTPLAEALGQLQLALADSVAAAELALRRSDDAAVARILRRRLVALTKAAHELDLLVAALAQRAASS